MGVREIEEWQRRRFDHPSRGGDGAVMRIVGAQPGHARRRTRQTLAATCVALPAVVAWGVAFPTWSAFVVAVAGVVPAFLLVALLSLLLDPSARQAGPRAIILDRRDAVSVRSTRHGVEELGRLETGEVRWARLDTPPLDTPLARWTGGTSTLVTLGGPEGEWCTLEVSGTRPELIEQAMRRLGVPVVPPLARRVAWSAPRGALPTA